jgi:hypothetical protein
MWKRTKEQPISKFITHIETAQRPNLLKASAYLRQTSAFVNFIHFKFGARFLTIALPFIAFCSFSPFDHI